MPYTIRSYQKKTELSCLPVCLSVEIICISLHICNPFLCFFRIKFITCKILYITTVHLSYSKDNLFLDKLLAISCIFLYFRHFLPAIKTKQIKRTQDFTQCHLDKDYTKNSVYRNMYPVLFL